MGAAAAGRVRKAGAARAAAVAPLARVLAIGDELILGRIVDTNSTHIAARLNDLGLRVARCAVVGDRQEEIEAAMRDACRGAQLVVCTGGLGPTDDDRTRHALAAVLGQPLVERAAALRAIMKYYRGRQAPASNRRQALFPRGATMLTNDRGTAPGILATLDGCLIACVPGVPHEMVAMVDRLLAALPGTIPGLRPPRVGELYLSGIGESLAQEKLGGLLSECDPQVGITASELGHLCLRVVGRAGEVRERMAALRACVGPWRLPGPGLAASLVGELVRRKQTITAAESCTCGHVAAQLGAVPGVSRVLRESLVAYHVDAKRRLLGVDAALVARHGVVSAEVAAAMANGARRASGADVAIATTGVAGPGGGTAASPVGTVWLAVATADGVRTRRSAIKGSRERIQRRAAAQALSLAWDVLSGRPD